MMLAYSLLCFTLLYIAYVDIRRHKISNFFCAALLFAGLLLNSFHPEGLGFYNSGLGLLAGFVPMLVIHLLTGLGAGDVKLMGALGSILGIKAILSIFIYSFMFSGVYAICYLAVSGRLWHLCLRILRLFSNKRLPGTKTTNSSEAQTVKNNPVKLAMAPGIFLATSYVLYPKILQAAL